MINKLLMQVWDQAQDLNFGEIRQVIEAADKAAKDTVYEIRKAKIAAAGAGTGPKNFLFVFHWQTIQTTGADKGRPMDVKEAVMVRAATLFEAEELAAKSQRISRELMLKKNFEMFILHCDITYMNQI